VEREGDVGVDGWEAVAEEGEGWKGREGFDLEEGNGGVVGVEE
jgi:hypothetical protein